MLYLKQVTVFDSSGHAYPVSNLDQLFRESGHWQARDLAGGVRAIENLKAMPAAWMAHKVQWTRSDEEAMQVLQSGIKPDGTPFDAQREILLPEGSPASFGPEATPSASAIRIDEWTGSEKSFQVDTGAPGVLVVSNRFYPGWTATLNDVPQPILNADAVLQAVALPPGHHRVTLRYRPTHFLALALVALLAMLCIAYLAVRRTADAPMPRNDMR
jgi:hypothetical protein